MKPTREQILAEPAGPRLNRWVGEYVMGCGEEEDECGLYSLIVPGGVNQLDFCNPGACWSAVPKYSEDIGPAWEVVERSRAAGWYFRLSDVIETDEWIAYLFAPDSSGASGVADTAPLAICRAALLTVLENQ